MCIEQGVKHQRTGGETSKLNDWIEKISQINKNLFMLKDYNNIRVLVLNYFLTLNFYSGKGISHFCCKSEAVKNLIMLAEGLGNSYSEYVVYFVMSKLIHSFQGMKR